jgi:opacity protein-like surface antigen
MRAAAGAFAFAVGAGAAEAGTGLYDMTRFLNEPHPFAQATTPPAPPAAQPRPAAPVPRPAAAPPPPAAAPAPPIPPRARPGPTPASSVRPSAALDPRPLGLKGGFYVTLNAIGTPYSEVSDHSATGITGLDVRHDSDQVAANSLALGYSWKDRWHPARLELEGGYRYRFDLDYRGRVGATTVGYEANLATAYAMLNGYYDFVVSERWTPYVGVGLGWARNSADTDRNVVAGTGARQSVETSTNEFSWAAMAGLTYNWRPDWGVSLGVRYVDLGGVEVGPFAGGDKIEADYWSIDVTLGLTHVF